jgi:hypothetical protein
MQCPCQTPTHERRCGSGPAPEPKRYGVASFFVLEYLEGTSGTLRTPSILLHHTTSTRLEPDNLCNPGCARGRGKLRSSIADVRATKTEWLSGGSSSRGCVRRRATPPVRAISDRGRLQSESSVPRRSHDGEPAISGPAVENRCVFGHMRRCEEDLSGSKEVCCDLVGLEGH